MVVSSPPRVTFGIIVLNGEPFTRYCLRALYPFAYEIIVVEGATPDAQAIATPDGHSRDATRAVLREFVAREDPEGKMRLITAEDEGHPNGFWPGEKDEMSRAYARRARGDWLWQIDIDEFYMPADMERLLQLLAAASAIHAVSFDMLTFWGGLTTTVDGFYLRRGARTYHRLFRFAPGFRYTTHRPPTVVDGEGRDLRTRGWLSGADTARLGIRLYHASLVFPQQVRDKCAYYDARLRPGVRAWAEAAYFRLGRPFHVHNVFGELSWLEPYRGPVPPALAQLFADARAGRLTLELRPTVDVEALLQSWRYRIGRAVLKRSAQLLADIGWWEGGGRAALARRLWRSRDLGHA